jgi:hypothetical protein
MEETFDRNAALGQPMEETFAQNNPPWTKMFNIPH